MQHLNDTMKTKHESYVALVISAKKKNVRGRAKKKLEEAQRIVAQKKKEAQRMPDRSCHWSSLIISFL